MAARKKKQAKKAPAKKPAVKALGNDPFARGAATRELKTAPPPSGPRARPPTPELQEQPSGKAIISAALTAPEKTFPPRRTGSLTANEPSRKKKETPAGKDIVSAAIAAAHTDGQRKPAASAPTSRATANRPTAPRAPSRRASDTETPRTRASAPTFAGAPSAQQPSPHFATNPSAHHASPAFAADPAAHHASPAFEVDPAAHHASPVLSADPEAHHASPMISADPVAHHDAPTADLIDGPVPHFSSPTLFDATPFASSPTLIGAAPTPPPAPFESSPTLVEPEAPPFSSSPTVTDAAITTHTASVPTSAEGGFLSSLLAAVRAGVGLASRTTQVDHWGKDATLASSLRPLGDLLYDRYFRVQVEGAQHLPSGPCIIVANHAGALPLDGPMLHLALRRERPDLPESRWLLEDQIFHAPFAGVLANRLGAVRANPENAHRLLDEGRPIIVFPEGFHGLSKPFTERYQLRRFGRGGYVKIAVRRGVPIVPVAIVGGEESMPLLAKVPAKFLGVEHLPITPPPLPAKWFIRFSPAFDLSDAPPQAETNLAWVERTNLSVRDQIEAMITDLLKQRQSVF